MAEQEQITVEELSPSPIDPVVPTDEEEQEQPTVEAPTPTPTPAPDMPPAVPQEAPVVTEEQLVLPDDAPRPADPDEVLASATQKDPISRIVQSTRETVGPYISGAIESFQETFPDSVVSQMAKAQDVREAQLPAVLPKPFIMQVQEGLLTTPEQIEEARNKQGEIYWRGIFSTGDGVKDRRRKDVIQGAVGYGIPKLDAQGNPVRNPEFNPEDPTSTKYIYDRVVPFDTGIRDLNTRYVTMIEAVPNETGIYHLITEDGWKSPKVLDTGRRAMLEEFQDPISAFFFRREIEDGGLENYRRVLEKGGIIDPARQTYYMKRQEEANNPFLGIERTRMGIGTEDLIGMLSNIAIGTPDIITDFTAALPFYWFEAAGGFTNLFSKEKRPYSEVTELAAEGIDRITGGNVDHLYFDDAITRFAQQADVSQEEAEAVLTYSPDLVTTGARYGIEATAMGGPILGGSRALAAEEASKFGQWAVREARGLQKEADWLSDSIGKTEIRTMEDAFKVLEDAGIDSAKALQRYVDENGGGKLGRAYLSDALDLDVQARAMMPGTFRAQFLKPKIDQLATDLNDIDRKIEAAKASGRSGRYIATLETRRQTMQKSLISLREETLMPQVYRKFLQDETLSASAGAVAYQAYYDFVSADPFFSSLASASASVMTVLPGVRGMVSGSVEDIGVWFSTLGDPDAYTTRSAAVKLRRHVEKAPPEIRDQIMAFAEYRQGAMEELAKFTFPQGHPRAGEQILSDDAFDQGFYRSSGLLSLRHLRNSQLGDTLNVQSDAGKLSEGLAEIEKTLQQEQLFMEESAQLFDNFRYIMFSEDFDPESPAGKFVSTLVKYYDQNKARLDSDMSTITEIVEQRQSVLNSFLTGELPTSTMEGVLIGEQALADLIRVDRIHYERLNMKPDATIEENLGVIDSYYKELNSRVAKALERQRRGRFDKNAETANNTFQLVLESSEQRAYQLASARFDAIRQNPEFADARVDMTDVFDMLLVQGEDGITIDTRALGNLTTVGTQGTYNSQTLAKLDIPASTRKLVANIFEESAGEYIRSVEGTLGGDMIQRLVEAEGIKNPTDVDRFVVVRKYIEENRAALEDAGIVYENIQPRLGLDASAFMHVISGLGKKGGDYKQAAELRQDLLGRGRTGFVDNFYDPTAPKENLEGFGEAYDDAREFYVTSYIDPFRNMNKSIARILREPDAAVRANALESFMDEAGLNKPVRSAAELEENLTSVIKAITGGRPLDVNSDEGKIIRHIFTKYVQDEIARNPGGKKFQAMLIRNYDAFTRKSPLVIPEKALELEAELASGVTGTVSTRLENLLAHSYDENGNKVYAFADDFGNPIVDPKAIDMISFENGMMYDQRFRDAAISVKSDIKQESDEILKRVDDVSTVEGNEILARRQFAEKFEGQYQGGVGEAFYTLALQGNGDQILRMKEDFVSSQVAQGVDAEVAAEAFEQVKVQTVTDYIFDTISGPGDNRAFKDIGPDGEVESVVKRTSVINPAKLFQMLGARGDTVSRSRQETILRELLSDEVVDHMKFVGDELFEVDTQSGRITVRGISMPMSAESLLSRGTSFARGVISLRWLVSEAAIRESRRANMELTKIMLFNPKAGRQIVEMITEGDYDVAEEPEFIRVLISTIAKNDALQQYALGDANAERDVDVALSGVQRALEEQESALTTEEQMDKLSLEAQMSEVIGNRMGR